MKIVVISSLFKPQARGGAEIVAEAIARGLKARGQEVAVISIGRRNIQEQIDGLPVFRVQPVNVFNFLDISSQPVILRLLWHFFDLFNFSQANKISKILQAEKPDLVIANSLKGLGYLVPRAIKKLKIKYIQIIHDAQLLHPSGLFTAEKSADFFTAIYAGLCRSLFGRPDLVVFPSNYIKKIHQQKKFFTDTSQIVLGNPITISGFSSVPHRDATFLFLGQIEKHKGVETLIRAFMSVPGEIKLWLVGDGGYLAQAKQLAKADARIKFWGRLTPAELEQKIWPAVDVLINPSEVTESFGLVVLEAYAHGLPVMASNIGALPELITVDKTGWLFQVGDGSDLANKLRLILAGRNELKQFKNRCLAKAGEFTLDAYLDRIISVVHADSK
ncbi:MAG: glycosyltransferase family 4 protein [Patescibacteria group bacterium]